MDVPAAYTVEGEVGLSMFGEREEEEGDAAKLAVADIEAEHKRTTAEQTGQRSGKGATSAASGKKAAASTKKTAAAAKADGSSSAAAAATPAPPAEPAVALTPMEQLLQAESKLSLCVLVLLLCCAVWLSVLNAWPSARRPRF